MTGIDRTVAPPPVSRRRPIRFRLSCSAGSNLGIGTALAAHVLATAVELNEKAACRAVVVTALNPIARTWWERPGFHPFHHDDRRREPCWPRKGRCGAGRLLSIRIRREAVLCGVGAGG
jgi:hypothetical protein